MVDKPISNDENKHSCQNCGASTYSKYGSDHSCDMYKINLFITCLGCGYQISVLERRLAQADFECPRCHEYKFSKFNVQRTITNQSSGAGETGRIIPE